MQCVNSCMTVDIDTIIVMWCQYDEYTVSVPVVLVVIVALVMLHPLYL